MKKWLTIQEVMSLLAYSRSEIYRMIEAGKFTVLRPNQAIGSKGIRIDAESVKRFEAANTVSGEW